MDNDQNEVAARWREGLARSASQAYQAAHGNPIPDVSRGVRWRLDPRVAVTLAVVVGCAGLLIWWSAPAPSAAPEPIVAVSITEDEGREAVVHVAGDVHDPGLVTVALGARVADALAAAGGPADGADTSAINLARPVVDGEQIYVPGQGERAEDGPVNLNRADVTDLEALPGIGPVLAERIVTDRDLNGPFASVDDLGRVSGVGPLVLENIGPLVSV
jgi:competence protein ComEA